MVTRKIDGRVTWRAFPIFVPRSTINSRAGSVSFEFQVPRIAISAPAEERADILPSRPSLKLLLTTHSI